MSTDQEWIEETRTITDPLKMLECIVENQDFLGYDPYYSDLRRAMLETAEQIVIRVKDAPGCYDCGKRYEECGDVSMDNVTWKQISPTGDEGGLLCANCTMDRLRKVGLSGISVKLYP